MQCPECGAIVSEQDLFCGECGAVLSAPQPPPPGEPVVELRVEPPAAPAPPGPLPPPAPPYSPALRDSRANAAFILGIISIALTVLACIPFISVVSCVEPVIGVIAIILGAIAKRDIGAKGGLEEDRKKAHQGMIMGIVGTAIYLLLVIGTIVLGIGLGVLSD